MTNISNLNSARRVFVDAVYAEFGQDRDELTRDEIIAVCEKNDLTYPAWFAKPVYRVSRGTYSINLMLEDLGGVKRSITRSMKRQTTPTLSNVADVRPISSARAPVQTRSNDDLSIRSIECSAPSGTFIPTIDKTFVQFGYFSKLQKIIEKRVFMPVFISGLSGNGKTFIAEQTCALAGREFINVPITIETTEDDLLGGFRLIQGETVWSNGPVVEAMLRGAVLMLDEIDLATHRIMCLQSIIDGKGVYLKKINKMIKPAPGFQVLATANTKGKGKWKGNFVGTNVLNEAFLERFAVTFEQEYPEAKIEKKILNNVLDSLGCSSKEDKNFASLLVEWSKRIRNEFNNGECDEVISTRRLISVIKYYSVFGDRLDAVKECTNRFSDQNKLAFISLYAGMDGDADLLEQIQRQRRGDDEQEVETVQVRF